MKKMNRCNKILLCGVLLLLVTLALAIGAASAYYSDREVITGNSFTAGALQFATCNNPITVDGVMPGDTGRGGQSFCNGTVCVQIFKNTGNVPGELTWGVLDVVNDEGLNFPAEVDTVQPGELGGVLYITKIVIGSDMGPGLLVSDDIAVVQINQTLDDLSGKVIETGAVMPPGEVWYCEIYWAVDPAAGNEIMGDTVMFSIDLTLNQVHTNTVN